MPAGTLEVRNASIQWIANSFVCCYGFGFVNIKDLCVLPIVVYIVYIVVHVLNKFCDHKETASAFSK